MKQLKIIILPFLIVSVLFLSNCTENKSNNLDEEVNRISRNIENTHLNSSEDYNSLPYQQTKSQIRLIVNQMDNLASSRNNLSESEKYNLYEIQESLDKYRGYKVSSNDVNSFTSESSAKIINSFGLLEVIPLITNYTPSRVVETDKPIQINFEGLNLSDVSANLTMQGTECTFKEPHSFELMFVCSNIFNNVDQILESKGLLLLENKNGVYSYDVNIFVFPKNLGKYEVDFVVSDFETVISEQKKSFSFRNKHCGGSFVKTFSISSVEGEIDGSSIDLKCSSSSRSSCLKPKNVTDTGFQVQCKIRNNGDCIKVFGSTVSRDGRGSCQGTVSWNEKKIDKTKVKNKLVEGSWGLGDLVSIDMPEGTISYTSNFTPSSAYADYIFVGFDNLIETESKLELPLFNLDQFEKLTSEKCIGVVWLGNSENIEFVDLNRERVGFDEIKVGGQYLSSDYLKIRLDFPNEENISTDQIGTIPAWEKFTILEEIKKGPGFKNPNITQVYAKVEVNNEMCAGR